MPSLRARLAQRVLETLANGGDVPNSDAFQLRNWADQPEDALLPLVELARRILSHENSSTNAEE